MVARNAVFSAIVAAALAGPMPASLPAAPSGTAAQQAPVDLYQFMVMDQRENDGKQHYRLAGRTRCPNGYDPQWCARPINGWKRDGFHKTYRAASSRYGCIDEFVLLKGPKSPAERFCADDGVRIIDEVVDWRGNAEFRTFENERLPFGAWGFRDIVSGQYHIERGNVHYFTCPEKEVPAKTYDTATGYWFMGPYEITSAAGRARAQVELAPYTPPGRPVIEPAWLRFNKAFGRPRAPIHLLVRLDNWSPFDPNTLREGEQHWRAREEYWYLSIGYGTNDWTGAGLVSWSAWWHHEPDAPMIPLRETVFDRVVKERRPSVAIGLCAPR